MKRLVKSLDFKGTIIDVGSLDVNGSYKDLFDGWKYIGVDLCAGKNVDEVVCQYYIPFDNVDLVISGSCLEHDERPWLLVGEIYRILKPGGICFLNAPASIREHRYPIDCWRILPDGMASLMLNAGFKDVKSYIKPDNAMSRYHRYNIIDCWGVGVK